MTWAVIVSQIRFEPRRGNRYGSTKWCTAPGFWPARLSPHFGKCHAGTDQDAGLQLQCASRVSPGRRNRLPAETSRSIYPSWRSSGISSSAAVARTSTGATLGAIDAGQVQSAGRADANIVEGHLSASLQTEQWRKEPDIATISSAPGGASPAGHRSHTDEANQGLDC